MNTLHAEAPFSFAERVRYRVYALLAKGLSRLSASSLNRMADALARLLWRCLPRRRDIAVQAVMRHLRCPEERARSVARASFTENCRSFFEIFHVARFDARTRLRCLPPDFPAALRAESSPVVLASAHIGSWELLAAPDDFIPHTRHMTVVRNQPDRAMARIMAELRGARGVESVGHRQAAGAALDCLRRPGAVGFLVDHNCSRREAVFLPFLEDVAAVNSGPAILALRAKAVVCPLFIIREAGGRHVAHAYPPLRTAELQGGVAERVEAIARYYTDCVADIVKKYPEQWMWMHKRWKTRP